MAVFELIVVNKVWFIGLLYWILKPLSPRRPGRLGACLMESILKQHQEVQIANYLVVGNSRIAPSH